MTPATPGSVEEGYGRCDKDLFLDDEGDGPYGSRAGPTAVPDGTLGLAMLAPPDPLGSVGQQRWFFT